MEVWLPAQALRQQAEENKEQQQPASIKKVQVLDGELLKFSSSEQPGRGRPPPLGPGKENEANIEVIIFDSDSSTEFRERGSPDASFQKLRLPAEGSRWLESGRGGRYSGRLRPTTPKKYNWDCFEEEEIGFLDHDFEIYEKTVAKELQDAEQLPNWGRKKHRTDQWSSHQRSHASCIPASKQATQSRNLLDCGETTTSQGGLTTWRNRKRTNKLPPFSWKDGRRALGWESAALKYEIPVKKTRSGQSQHEGNAVAVHNEVSPSSHLRLKRRILSSCKRNKLVRKGNMVTHIESFPREFGRPAAPIKSKLPTRKRKGGVLADQSLEYQSLNVLTNRRPSWPDSSERPTQQQFHPLSSDGENVEGPSRKMADLLEQSPNLSSNLHLSEIDKIVTGEYFRGDPIYSILDDFVNGHMCRPSPAPTRSQFNYEKGPSPIRTLNTLGVDIGSNLLCCSQGEGDVYRVPDRDTFSIASEPSTNDSFETAQSEARQTSDDDYRPPASYSNFQPLTGNVDIPTPANHPPTRRRHDGATQRVTEMAALFDNLQNARVTHNKGTTQPSPNTFAAVHVNPITDSQHGSFSTIICPSANGVHTGNLDVLEDLETDEPNDGNVLDEEEARGQVLFDLNELPEEQARTNPKARKKHRPKVFREGRPYRARKPKKTEENISKPKVSEGQKVVEKPRARKKRATADLPSTQGNSLDKQGGHSTPVAANCGPIATDPPGCAQCQESQRVLESGVLSPERRAVSDKGLLQSTGEHDISQRPQTPAPEGMLVEAPNNMLIYYNGETSSLHARDGSPLSISSSAAPCLSRKRTGELDSLTVSDAPASRRGARRELFKKARGKRSAAAGKENSGLGESCQESLNVASPHSILDSATKIVEAVPQTNSESSECQALGPLQPLERRVKAAAADAGSVAAEGVGAENPKRHDPRKPQGDVTGESHIFPNEVGKIDGSTITSEGTVSHAINGRMRAAARAKSRRPIPSTCAQKLPTSCSPSRPRQTDTATSLEQIQSRMAHLELDECRSGLEMVPHVIQHSALVPYEGPFMPLRRKKPRARVMLDGEDKRVWRLLMAKGTSFEDHDSEKDAPKMWEEERALMKSRAERFINRMHLVQGDRRFSIWKGSVIDSVVGAFLTQNVSDHLSSSAFMCLAARFPVPRKKKATAETSQETPFTEVRVEEAFEISQQSSGFPVSSNSAAVVQETSVTTFHVEEAFDVSEKLSVMGGESCISCHRQDLDAVSTKATDFNCGSQQACCCCKERVGSMSHNYTATVGNSFSEQMSTLSTELREQNSSCSSKASQSQCNSCLPIVISQATKCWDVRGNGQVNPSRAVEDFTSPHSGLEDVLFVSSGDSQVNSTCHTVLVDSYEQEVHEMALPPSKAWIQNDPELLLGSLVVDLSPSADDLLREGGLQQSSTCEEFFTLTNNPKTHEGNNPSATAEEGGANSGSVSFSSDSFEGSKLSQTSTQLGSQVQHCVGGEKSQVHASSVIFSSDSFDTDKVSEQHPLITSVAEISEDAGVQLYRGLNHTKESSNLHTLKSHMRKKLQVRRKAPLNTDSNSHDFNMKYTSELVNSSSSNQEKEGEGPKKISFLGLTGIARGRLEQANITSKVAFDWEAVRLKYTEPEMCKDQNENAHTGCKTSGSSNVENGVDWEAVRSAKLEDIADVIKERGMNNVLAGRIKAFLERVQKEHGSLDLEWLRTISVEEAKSFLLSIRGLGLKSVECIRLLTLHHLAFPVDTNVGRICVRLGWVPLEPLPEELQLHLLELYPVQETIQKYLWPRLCSLDQRTLYELHYQMITFGKVFCTKSRPNCNACPMRDDCQHFASALASARLALPATAHDDAHSTNSEQLALPAAAAAFIQKAKLALPPLRQDATPEEEGPSLSKLNSFILSQKPCEPIIEEPRTPERVVSDVTEIEDIEQLLSRADEYDILVGVSSQPSGLSKDTRVEVDIVLPPAEVSTIDTSSKALVLLPPGIASLPVPKLKNVGRLRTVHYVYELPDHHPLLQEMDPREPDDPCVYLLAIWSPGESPQAPPVLDDLHTNGTCDGFDNSDEETVKGTVLVPCRTAMRGIFPLNGTYFQVNEVFADHASSLQPIEVPRTLLWNLRRRFVYFGTSVTTIFKGLSTEEIQACFWRGYVCVRGFDSITRCPRPLAARLHFPASKMIRKQKDEKDINSNAKAQNKD